MAGETSISVGSIEKRAEELEVKQAEEAKKAKEAEGAEKVEENPAEGAEKETPAKDPVTGKFQKKEEPAKQPDDPKELRKWATRLSMENAEIRKQMENLASMLTKSQKEKIDWKELAKDPVKLQQMVEKREAELVESHKSEYQKQMEQSAAEITQYESNARYKDAENYPRWGELMPIMKQLSDPSKPDQRINFNQHPKVVLDALYELAQDIADTDPNYKKPEPAKKPAASGAKSYSQEEFDAAVAKAKEDALKEQSKGLAAEAKGASVAGMGKGATKGKPGEVNKEALWNMPLESLKSTVMKATDELHGR